MTTYTKKRCIHDKIQYICIECGGKGICEHGKQKCICKQCVGSRICEHNREKNKCKECGGISICEHNVRKAQCKKCKGSSICIHDKYKTQCKECNGKNLCIHQIIKSNCINCTGSGICEHKKRRNICIDCNGSQLCEHKKQKYNCIICKGSQICDHGKYKRFCKEHDGRNLCKSSLCETTKNKNKIKFQGYCTYCFIHIFPDEPITRNYKTKETCVRDYIKENFPNDQWVCDRQIKDGCSRKRPDVLLDVGSHVLIIEIDENKHSTYDCSCENKRLMELSLDIGHRPIVFLRFNPDANDTSSSCWTKNKTTGILYVSKQKKTEWDNRLHTLIEQIIYWKEYIPSKTVEIIELFY